jgi:beta-N-acetylhexosaminidase
VKAFGFNCTLAPVLDLGLPESAGVMGTRTAGATAGEVVEYTRPFFAGLKRHGVTGCGKHFPGLGGGTLDSHRETPKIARTWKQLWRDDLAPYRALRDEIPMVMVSHGAYPRTKGGKRPASVSRFWIGEVLRKQIGYRGIVLSDDMEMGGVLNAVPMEEAVVEAVRAGSDLVEICHQPALILRAYEGMVREGERSAAFRRILLKRARDAEKKRVKTFAGSMAPALSARQFEALRAEVRAFGKTIAEAV